MAINTVRSISLPSRIHPTSLKFQSRLAKLKSWDSSSSPSSSCSSSQTQPIQGHAIETGLTTLVELFHSVEQLLLSPLAANSFHPHSQQVEDALEGSVGLLDVCTTAKELVLAMKEHVHCIESAVRRRNPSSIQASIQAYFSFRKKAKKAMSRSLRLVSRKPISSSSNSSIIQSIREAREAAASVFESLLLFLSSPVVKANGKGMWTLLVMKSKLSRSEGSVRVSNEVGSLDAALWSYDGEIMSRTKFDVKEVQRRLECLGGCMEGMEGKLDRVFRCLIKNRASLLNLVTSL